MSDSGVMCREIASHLDVDGGPRADRPRKASGANDVNGKARARCSEGSGTLFTISARSHSDTHLASVLDRCCLTPSVMISTGSTSLQVSNSALLVLTPCIGPVRAACRAHRFRDRYRQGRNVCTARDRGRECRPCCSRGCRRGSSPGPLVVCVSSRFNASAPPAGL